MAKARNHDPNGAIDDYTLAIDMPNALPNVKAMALYNRALVYAAAGDRPKAIADLNVVLAMTEQLTEIKTEARRKLVRMQRHAKQQ